MDLLELHAPEPARHPWELARARFFLGRLRAAGLFSRPVQVLDAGAGDAFFAARLAAELPAGSAVTAWDAHYTPEHLELLQRTAGPVQFTRGEPEGRFDLLTLLDVLEHVEDDAGFLRGLLERHVPRGGAVLVSVPAWMELFSSHDVRLRHHRRYAPAQVRALLEGAGLEVLESGGLFHSLLPARAAGLAREKLLGPSPDQGDDLGTWSGGRLLTLAVELGLRADNALSTLLAARGLELPGLSWWARCQMR